jgi:flagellar hook-basal body complex protein FliE
VTPIIPDVASPAPVQARQFDRSAESDGFGKSLDAAGSALGAADTAEENFASGTGSLQAAIYERARADVVLAVATAAAQRGAQALQAIFTMQV